MHRAMPDDDQEHPESASESPELTACLERLAAGDLTARERIVELLADRLRILTRRMLARFPNVRRWDDTDDVFQNAALRLYRALGRPGETPRSVLALAAAELHRELLDLARRYAGPHSHASHHATNVIRGAVGDALSRDEHVAEPDDDLDRWSRFQEAVAELPAGHREVFDLVWYLGADQRTIAKVLGCSPRTVKSRWREVRQAVRDAVDEPPTA
jgi:RNA polymerase sigma factor (sigma-70 family)